MAFVPIIAGITTAISAAGTLMEGQAASSAANFEARQLEDASREAGRQGAAEEGRIRREGQRVLGEQIANTGASGLQFTGSPLRVAVDSQAENEMDALNARYEASMRARGYTIQAQGKRQEAKSAKTASYIAAGTQLLKGASNADFFGLTLPSTKGPQFTSAQTTGERALVSSAYNKL